jgi:hypothetical protein
VVAAGNFGPRQVATTRQRGKTPEASAKIGLDSSITPEYVSIAEICVEEHVEDGGIVPLYRNSVRHRLNSKPRNKPVKSGVFEARLETLSRNKPKQSSNSKHEAAFGSLSHWLLAGWLPFTPIQKIWSNSALLR